MLEGEEVNVAIGKQATQSSDYGGSDPSRAVSGEISGTFAFSTQLERNPWWIVDLGAVTPIGRIVIWNRNDTGPLGAERARPLRIEISDDGITWRTLAYIDYCFGGRDFGKPLTIEPLNLELAKHIRLTVEAETYLHLDQVQVFLRPPSLRFGQLRGLRLEDSALKAELVSLHDSGFFSSCSTTLDSLVQCRAHAVEIDRIDCSRLFSVYQDVGTHRDVWQHVFVPDRTVTLPSPRLLSHAETIFTAFHAHFHYRDLQFDKLVPFIRRYCNIADPVSQIQKNLASQYEFDPDNFITLCYRGTDKVTEILPADISQYIEKAEELLIREPRLRVLIQTDQQQIRDEVVRHFGSRCLFFPEMPVTTGREAVHNMDMLSLYDVRPYRFAQTLVAVMELIARSKYLITHSGNGGLWMALFRGTANRLFQFDSQQQLIAPPSSDN